MEISQYLTLKNSNVYSFEKSYKSVNSILLIFSFIGNIASIIFAYFFLYTILYNVTDNFFAKKILVGIITVISLTAFELLKRFLFRQGAICLVTKKPKYERISITLLSLLIVSSSFYLSLNGAKTLSDKKGIINIETDKKIDLKISGINADFSNRIATVQKQIATYNDLMINGTKSVKLRMQLNGQIDKANTAIEKLNIQRGTEINNAKKETQNKALQSINISNDNVVKFLCLSSFIELIILIGVGFDVYYNHRIFIDFDTFINSSPRLKKYLFFHDLLAILYNNGTIKKRCYVLTPCRLSRIAKSQDINITSIRTNDFYKLLNHLKVINKKTGVRYTALMNFTEAQKALKEYYKLG